MANEIFDESVPSNTEGVKLGAQRMREIRTTLNLLLKRFWSDGTGTLQNNSVTTPMITDLAVTNAKIADGTLTAAKFASGAAMPVSTVLPFAGAAAPTGFALCAGQSVLRADPIYSALFAVIGSTYGSVDGTHFTLPDLRGRAPWGMDNMGGSPASRLTTGTGAGTTLGAGDGEQTHLLTVPEMPNHTHTIPQSSDTVNTGVGGAKFFAQGATVNTGGTGGGLAHNNMPPYLLMNYIIKL
jgi:microcystin-dependent protein